MYEKFLDLSPNYGPAYMIDWQTKLVRRLNPKTTRVNTYVGRVKTLSPAKEKLLKLLIEMAFIAAKSEVSKKESIMNSPRQ